MEYQYNAVFFDKVKIFINNLPLKDQEKVIGAATALETGDFQSVFVKQLRGEIKELRVKKYRLIFFIHANSICFIRIFIKKSKKTPKNEIDIAEKIYKLFIENKIP
ncbi:MAG: type II toxin-antitoxin system RelE/ParE family toxin [Candidatus Zambryskibacteria bacterium]|nr:type II toxin-antitoxin system RelE/ParE family toxin [Candidatus Zambryskibacteria bacterium]